MIPLGGLLLQEAGNEVLYAHVHVRPVQPEKKQMQFCKISEDRNLTKRAKSVTALPQRTGVSIGRNIKKCHSPSVRLLHNSCLPRRILLGEKWIQHTKNKQRIEPLSWHISRIDAAKRGLRVHISGQRMKPGDSPHSCREWDWFGDAHSGRDEGKPSRDHLVQHHPHAPAETGNKTTASHRQRAKTQEVFGQEMLRFFSILSAIDSRAAVNENGGHTKNGNRRRNAPNIFPIFAYYRNISRDHLSYNTSRRLQNREQA